MQHTRSILFRGDRKPGLKWPEERARGRHGGLAPHTLRVMVDEGIYFVEGLGSHSKGVVSYFEYSRGYRV